MKTILSTFIAALSMLTLVTPFARADAKDYYFRRAQLMNQLARNPELFDALVAKTTDDQWFDQKIDHTNPKIRAHSSSAIG